MPVKGNAALRYILISSWAKEQQKDLISLLLEWKQFLNSFSVYEHARVRPFSLKREQLKGWLASQLEA